MSVQNDLIKTRNSAMNLCVYIYIFFAMIDTTSKITLSNILIKGLLYCFTLLSLSAKDARSKHLIVGAGAQSTYLYIIWHCEGHVPWIVHMLLIILKWIWTIAYDSQFDMYIYIWFYAHRYRCISYPLFQGSWFVWTDTVLSEYWWS